MLVDCHWPPKCFQWGFPLGSGYLELSYHILERIELDWVGLVGLNVFGWGWVVGLDWSDCSFVMLTLAVLVHRRARSPHPTDRMSSILPSPIPLDQCLNCFEQYRRQGQQGQTSSE